MTTDAPARTTTPKAARWAVSAGAVGLIAGLGLGATGLAAASSSSPGPAEAAADERRPGGDRFGAKQLRKRVGPAGLVSAISATSLTVRTPAGTRTVTLNDSTAFYDGADRASATAVQVGEVVHVRVADPQADRPVATVVRVRPAQLAGWVTKVDGTRLTITDHDGFTRSISTSGSTAFTKDGQDSALSGITVGAFVRAVGSVAEDGSTLEAKKVATGRPERMGRLHRPGGPMRPGTPSS